MSHAGTLEIKGRSIRLRFRPPIEARNLVGRYLATSPRVSHMAINALKFGTTAKIYTPIIANAIAVSEQTQR